MKHQIPKGTFDILPYGTDKPWQISSLWQKIEAIVRSLCNAYDYKEIRTPIYEMTGLFDRGVGATSDIVTKEMFSFEDKGGRSITLRPEGTSCVMRAFIENHLANLGPVHKFFYIGPMFRHERPQSGRYRQHHQFGVEAIGNKGPEQDAEVIDLLFQFYKVLGLKNLTVHINTVGDASSRSAFKTALLLYLEPHFEALSEDSKSRFEKNPLRILDSKDPKDQEILKGAPSILDYLESESEKHFLKVCSYLKEMEIPFALNPKIVRGLDYYEKTVFEVLSGENGKEITIGAGGRFDGLIKTFGGPDLPAVGFATGLERVMQAMLQDPSFQLSETGPTFYFIPMGEEEKKVCLKLATTLRHNQVAASVEFHSTKMQTAIQNAIRAKAKFCVVLGSNELKNQTVQLKNLSSREQEEISFDELLTRAKKNRSLA